VHVTSSDLLTFLVCIKYARIPLTTEWPARVMVRQWTSNHKVASSNTSILWMSDRLQIACPFKYITHNRINSAFTPGYANRVLAWLTELTWVADYIPGWSRIQVLTGTGVEAHSPMVDGSQQCVIPYGKCHSVALREVSHEKLHPLNFEL